MNPTPSASSPSSAVQMPVAMPQTMQTTIRISSTGTTTTNTAMAAGAEVTALAVRPDQNRRQGEESLLGKLQPRILGQIGLQLHASRALRPALNAIARTSHAGNTLAVSLCSKLTSTQAEEQWDLDWQSLRGYFRQESPDERESFLAAVRTTAGQLSMTPMSPYKAIPHYFQDLTAPEFIASVPRVALRFFGDGCQQLALLESQLDMPADSRTEFTFTCIAGMDDSPFKRLFAAAERHGNCRLNLVDGSGSFIAEAASRQLLRHMYFVCSDNAALASVASALEGNTSLREANITIVGLLAVDVLILALSKLPCLQRLEFILPGPDSSLALAELVRNSSTLIALKVISSYRPRGKQTAPSAALLQAKAKLELELNKRGPALRWDIDPIFLPEQAGTATSREAGGLKQ